MFCHSWLLPYLEGLEIHAMISGLRLSEVVQVRTVTRLSTATRSPSAMICSIVQVKSGNSRLQTFEVLF
jgi:hypothetical protein